MASAPTVRRVDVEELPAHLATLEQELSEAGTIELLRGDIVIAEVRAKRVVALSRSGTERYVPDFAGRMKAIFGEKPMDTDITPFLREDRDSRD